MIVGAISIADSLTLLGRLQCERLQTPHEGDRSSWGKVIRERNITLE